uniref:Uncharacterized protein n=1 Tax=Avena sativa TaxID=4498 RepID=A0ACD5ZK19_AVESA
MHKSDLAYTSLACCCYTTPQTVTMAEFALGLTKTAVEGTVSRVKSAMEEEAKLKVRVQNDLVFITGEFEMMQSFLYAASAERTENKVVQTWVRQAVAEIKQPKARVEDVSQRNTRYNLIGDSGGGGGSISKLAVNVPSLSDQQQQATAASAAKASSSAFSILTEVWEAAGKKRSGTGDLRKLINNGGNGLQVISVWGNYTSTAGDAAHLHLGTSSCVLGEVYNDPEICNEFRIRAWVKLMHPFNTHQFLNSLLTQFHASCHRLAENINAGKVEFQTVDDHLVKADILKRLNEHRYLVVLEDLFSVLEWDVIRMYLPNSNNGSRIVVSTQQLGLAISCTGKPYKVSELKSFSGGQSLCAFYHKRDDPPQRAREWMEKIELLGREQELQDLVGCLYRNPGVTSVWGIEGVGKSSLVRHLYHTEMLGLLRGRKEFGKFGWVNVTHPFDLTEFSKHALLDFHSDDLKAKEAVAIGMMEGQDPIQGCCKFLHREKCFFVIDGLQSTHDWDLIRAAFLSKPIKSNIVVITTEASVAKYCVDHKDQVLNILGLGSEAALSLLLKTAGARKRMTPQEMAVSNLTITKCGGLSKVIVAIGDWCHEFKEKIPSLNYINDDFLGKLEKDSRFHNLKGLFTWMQSYFDGCPDSLKPCIFYLSVFPLGHNIRRMRLIRRWVAEGYSRDKFGSTIGKQGELLFSELIKLSIIQRQQQESPRKVDMCQVNGFFWEYIISRPMEDNLVFTLDGNCSINSQHVGQHLAISSGWDRDKIVFESMDLSRLRSLTVFGDWRSFFISSNANMRLLRVLDLEDTSGVRDGDIEKIGIHLPRLKFLSLRGCREVTRLPNSLGDMRQLQTLDIKNTSIVIIPPAIIKLQKLQYIRAGNTIPSARQQDDGSDATSTSLSPAKHQQEEKTPAVRDVVHTTTSWSSIAGDLMVSCRYKLHQKCRRLYGDGDDNAHGVKVPVAGIHKLTALHTLGVVNVTRSGKTLLKELKKLTQLRKLRVSGINGKNWLDLCFVISGHPHLESLSVQLDDEQDQCSLGKISKPPKTLIILKMYGGNVHVSPAWVKQLHNLRKVHLELTISTQEDIDNLIKLPCQNMFHHICVKPIQDGELHYGLLEDSPDREGFKAATVLKIDCSSHKLMMVFGHWIPKYVEVLVVHCSATRSSLEVFGLEKLRFLKEVWLKGSYSEAVKLHLQQKLEAHHRKPVLKAEAGW